MGGGKCTDMRLTAAEREDILKTIGIAPVDNDFITVREIVKIIGTIKDCQMRKRIIEGGYRIKKVYISGRYLNALTIADAKNFIAEWRGRN